MKSKVLPFSLLTLLIGLTVLLISFKGIDGVKKFGAKDQKNISNIEASTAYYSMLRNNQKTGKLDPKDVLLAENQISAKLKSAYNIDWTAMGPDNFAGRTRSILFDNTDSDGNTLFAGSVSGGIWKTDNAGLTWHKVNGETNNLNVSCMTQNSDGVIFVGTGELFQTQNYTGFGQLGYNGGFVGTGIYKSTDGENFELLTSTTPVPGNNDEVEWAYINEIAIDNGKIYAATNTGLRYSDDGGTTWNTPNFAHDSVYRVTEETYTINCDSIQVSGSDITMYNPITTASNVNVITNDVDRTLFPVNGICLDVKVSADGSVIVNYENFTLVYQSGNDFVFENKASYPDNPYLIVKLNSTITNTLIYPGGDTTYTYLISHDYEPYEGTSDDLSNYSVSRVEYAYSPSEPNIVYASAVNTLGSLINIYRSDDNGNTWSVILPGNSTTNIFNEQGTYSNTIIVFPNSSGKILLGGTDLWQGMKVNEEGYFSWSQRSNGLFFPMSDLYLHSSHHDYVFRPGHPTEFFVATDGGIGKGNINGEFIFQTLNKNYNSNQFYSVGFSGEEKETIGGSQGNGTIFISGEGNTFQTGENILPVDNSGPCDISLINSEVFIVSSNSGNTRFWRSEDRAENYSATSFIGSIDIPDEAFYTPAILWETFDDQNSYDTINYKATKDYLAGEEIYIKSNINDYPFPYILTENLSQGDSIDVLDIVQSKYFIATLDNVWMTKTIHDFSSGPEWFNIANDEKTIFSGNSQCLAYSSDANHLFVGTQEGGLFRMSNIAFAYNYERADCNSTDCIIATSKLPIYLPETTTEISQVITSVAVNPNDPNNVIITLGNYGNDYYVFMTITALDSLPVFYPIQGDLPQMPVYSSIIEMDIVNQLVMIGTENGIYVSTNVFDASPTWETAGTNIGDAPVFMLRQQIVKQKDVTIAYNIGTDTTYVTYKGTNNYGVIYNATHGRGLYKTDQFQKPVGINEPENNIVSDISFELYPNPVKDLTTVKFNLKKSATALVNVFDLNGRLINSIKLQNAAVGNNEIVVNCSTLSKGTYLIQLIVGQSTATSKFIVL
ncbi:MAG: T9SS type A sorting domain-containing protein [Bacteroidales bacterium]|nr:T9SS type A sorting domain-containing protein [Bacteroidales bacterium]